MSRNKAERLPRGSNPPFISLAEALRYSREIYEQGGGRCGYDILSRILGNSPSSSSFTKKVGALKGFGLVSESEKTQIELTDIGYAIVAPTSLSQEPLGRKAAFLCVDGYAKVYERHKGKLLPADEFLRNIFEQEIGVPKEVSNEWVVSFTRSAKAAGLLLQRADGKTQILDIPIGSPDTKPANTEEPTEQVESPKPKIESRTVDNPVASFGAIPETSGHVTKIELSGKRFAVFSIPDSLTSRDAQKLKGALTGLSAIIESMINDEQP